jgi:hypothetical protein
MARTIPVIPRAKVKNQNNPLALPWRPFAAVPSVAPRTMSNVVKTSATFRPMRSHTKPTNNWPMIAPTVVDKEK